MFAMQVGAEVPDHSEQSVQVARLRGSPLKGMAVLLQSLGNLGPLSLFAHRQKEQDQQSGQQEYLVAQVPLEVQERARVAVLGCLNNLLERGNQRGFDLCTGGGGGGSLRALVLEAPGESFEIGGHGYNSFGVTTGAFPLVPPFFDPVRISPKHYPVGDSTAMLISLIDSLGTAALRRLFTRLG